MVLPQSQFAKRIALTEKIIIQDSRYKDEDDLGKGGDAESVRPNAGDSLACGVITLYNKGE